MIITKEKLEKIITTTIIKTAQQCGKNLSIPQQLKIKNTIKKTIEGEK